MNWRLILAFALIAAAFFVGDESKTSIDYNSILKLEKQDVENLGLKNEVTDQIDRENIAIIHNEMGARLPKYKNVNTLQFENFYVNSTKEFFDGSLAGKYRDLGEKMYKVILSTLGENEGTITEEEMLSLSKKMRGLAWEILN